MEKAQPAAATATIEQEYDEFLKTLPKEIGMSGQVLYQYQGFWCPEIMIREVLSFEQQYKAADTDVILATSPKSGTTWLKALVFTIISRFHCPSLKNSLLLTTSPHALVHFYNDLDRHHHQLPHSRIIAVHSPYASLPCSVKESAAKIVYLCRNPLDQFISFWHFFRQLPFSENTISLEEDFDHFIQGIHTFGPFWDHVLGYWKAASEKPDKVLFLKYEDLMEDDVFYIKKLAKFMGFPFSAEEEKQGLVEEISRFCSFESMKDFEGNKTGLSRHGAPFSAFIRNGKVGDWVNYLTPSMVERMEKVMQEKFHESGLSFNLSYKVQKNICAEVIKLDH